MSVTRPKRKDIRITFGGMTHVLGSALPEDIIKAIADLNKKMRDDHRDNFVDEVTVIWNMCEQAFAAEFDAGYEYAQETVGDWLEHQRGAED